MTSFQSEPIAKDDVHEINEEPVCKKIKTESQCNAADLYFNKEVKPNYQSLHVVVPYSEKLPVIWSDNDNCEEENDCSTDLNASCDSSGIADCDGTENSSELLSEECSTSPSAPCQSTQSNPDIDCDDDDENSKDSLDSDDLSTKLPASKAETPKKRRVRFQKVQVYYFDRMQGFTCVPSQGGSTLGMRFKHWHKDDFPLTDYQRSRRQERRATLKKHYLQGKLQLCPEDQQIMEDVINRGSGGVNSDSTCDIKNNELSEEEELDDRLSYLEEFYFLQPVSLKKRRRMLKDAGTSKIERSERSACQDVRLSRELCGCDCPNGVCLPETCQCAQWNIQCQVDRSNFPCACTRQGCDNAAGRLEFNPIRVKTHFIHTQMRLEMERHGYDPSCESSVCSSDVSNFNSTEQGSCRDCQNQSYMHAIVQELRSAGLLPSIAPPPPPPPVQHQSPAVKLLQPPPEQIKFMNPDESAQITNVYPVTPAVTCDSNFEHSYSDEEEEEDDDDDEEDISSEEEEEEEEGLELVSNAPPLELQYQYNKDLQQQNYCYPAVNSGASLINYQQLPESTISNPHNYNSFHIPQTQTQTSSPPYTYCKLDPIDTLLHCSNIPPSESTNSTSVSSNLAPLLPSSSTKLTDLHYCNMEAIAPVIASNATRDHNDTINLKSDLAIGNAVDDITVEASYSAASSQSSTVSLGEILKNSIIETTVTV